MGNTICLLVACLYSDELLWCAVEFPRELLVDEYYMEPENREVIYNHLPVHCKYPIVEVREIFAVNISIKGE